MNGFLSSMACPPEAINLVIFSLNQLHALRDIPDRTEVREVFAAFSIEAVKVNYSVSAKGAGRGVRGEVLIAN